MSERFCGVSGVECLGDACPLVPSALECGYRTGHQTTVRGNHRKTILMTVPKNRRFEVDEGFVGKVVWLSKSGSTAAVVSTKRRALDEYYRTGKRDVYLISVNGA